MSSEIDLVKEDGGLKTASIPNMSFDMGDSDLKIEVKNRKKLVKILLCFLFILMIFLIVFIILYVGSSNDNLKSSKQKDICLSPECVQISAKMIEAMDPKIDPCQDFYQYACGGWLKETVLPDSSSRYSRFQQLSDKNNLALKQILQDLVNKKRKPTTGSLEKAATYYESCMDTKKIVEIGDKPLKELVKKLGSWSVTDTFNPAEWDAIDVLANIHRNTSRKPVFNMVVDADIKNSNENIVTFDQSGIIMDRESYLRDTPFHKRHREAYRKMMRAVAKEMGANADGVKLMDEVFEVEKKLAEITMTTIERRNYRSIYESMNLTEFSRRSEIPMDELQKYLKKIFPDTNGLPEDERIVSYNTKFIKQSYKIFKNLTAKLQSAYSLWHAVHLMSPSVLGKYQDIYDDYKMTAYGTKARVPRWVKCVLSAVKRFGKALSRPFIKDVYDKTAKDLSTEMIQAVKSVFTSNLDTMDWMDEETKIYARKKAAKMIDNIGYSEEIMNNTQLEKNYEGLEITKGQLFLNYMSCIKYANLKVYKKRGKPVDKSEWGIVPITVNAYYSPTENKISFPAGILQWPFYDRRAPRAVNYGAIGMVVGHEISHGFDDQGKDFTIEGNLDTWWTNYSATEFKKKAKCFIDQYSKFSMFGQNTKGGQTLGENLADNGAIRQSYQAYKSWTQKNGEEKRLPGLDLNSDQIYYLAFAQVWCTKYREASAVSLIENGYHALSNFRVQGTLQNSKEFSDAFNCPVGSPMNPERKCRVW